MKTWIVEAYVVAAVLVWTAAMTGHAVEWIGSGAVFFAFMHAQVADRLAEREEARKQPDVDCYKMAGRYFLAKEVLWCLYFVAHKSWTALIGVGVFLLYPLWRKLWRRWHPITPV